MSQLYTCTGTYAYKQRCLKKPTMPNGKLLIPYHGTSKWYHGMVPRYLWYGHSTIGTWYLVLYHWYTTFGIDKPRYLGSTAHMFTMVDVYERSCDITL
jgi:hypothetical protein